MDRGRRDFYSWSTSRGRRRLESTKDMELLVRVSLFVISHLFSWITIAAKYYSRLFDLIQDKKGYQKSCRCYSTHETINFGKKTRSSITHVHTWCCLNKFVLFIIFKRNWTQNSSMCEKLHHSLSNNRYTFFRNVEGGKKCVTMMGKLILWLALLTILCVIGFSLEGNFCWI